jgi:L-asparagine transporter-like permease
MQSTETRLMNTMEIREEFLVPLLYSVRREVYRFKISNFQSASRLLSSIAHCYLWVPIYALIVMNQLTEISVYFEILVYLLSFLVLYEIGYIVSDLIGFRFENRKVRRETFTEKIPVYAVCAGILVRLLFIGIIMITFQHMFNIQMTILYAFTLLIFVIHSFVNEKYKVGTFFGLRILKGMVPYAFLILILPTHEMVLILSGLIGISYYYSIEYAHRKLNKSMKIDIYNDGYSFVRFFIIIFLASIVSILFLIPLEKFLIFSAIVLIHHIAFIPLINQNE